MLEDAEQVIVECYLRVGTYEGVRQELGHSYTTIWKAIKKAGICKGRGGNQNLKISDEQILEDIALGLTRQEIADKRGVHVENLAKRMRKLGVHANYAKREFETSDWHYTKSGDDCVKKYLGEKFEFVAYLNKRYRIKCKSCGYTIERTASSIRRSKCLCDKCVEQEKEEKRFEKERIEMMRFIYANKPKECFQCKKVFYSPYVTTLYCSDKCKRKAKEKRYKEHNPEAYKKKRKKHRNNGQYIQRAKKYGCTYENGITLKKVIKKDNNICQICHKPCDINDNGYGTTGRLYPSIDHIIPLSKGGSHTWDNVQLAHMICNSYKRDLTR